MELSEAGLFMVILAMLPILSSNAAFSAISSPPPSFCPARPAGVSCHRRRFLPPLKNTRCRDILPSGRMFLNAGASSQGKIFWFTAAREASAIPPFNWPKPSAPKSSKKVCLLYIERFFM